jgi:hypothetical protein
VLLKKLLSIKHGKSRKKINQAIKAIDSPIWYASFTEAETGKEVIIKVIAKNKNEALDKVAHEIVNSGKLKPMNYNQISCI